MHFVLIELVLTQSAHHRGAADGNRLMSLKLVGSQLQNVNVKMGLPKTVIIHIRWQFVESR